MFKNAYLVSVCMPKSHDGSRLHNMANINILAGTALLRQGCLQELARVSTFEAWLFSLEAKALDSLRFSHPLSRQFNEFDVCLSCLAARVLDSLRFAHPLSRQLNEFDVRLPCLAASVLDSLRC